MRFDKAQALEDVIWQARIADLPRGEDRAILQRLYNGNPPFDEDKAEENNIEINRNNLSGVNLLSQARRQWNQAFLKPGNYFSVALDSGPVHKRSEWGHTITRHLNRQLKRSRPMMEQTRAVGANAIIFGQGPVCWHDRRSPVPEELDVSALLIPSETRISFDNLEWFAVYREWTPSKLYEKTHGPKVDPGWNMPMVRQQLKEKADQTAKEVNSLAYQYMPERIEELIKQDKGFWGSDAVPTVDVWDVYFREMEDGEGWYRRVILDWGISEGQEATTRPTSKNRVGDKYGFLYTSGKRKFANSLSEILHCQFADCSAIAPFRYHSVRSLGWMLWGICDLENRMYCKFTESVFQQMMWFFQNASDSALTRLRRADFFHFGIIPNGVSFLTADQRFKPDANLVNTWFERQEQLKAASAASFTQDFTKGSGQKEMTATETMARVNMVNALVSGMVNLAYAYEEFKFREIGRRFCVPNNPYVMVQKFRSDCLKDGVPAKYLNVDRWEVTAERALGAGNKTLEMAQAAGLQSIRKQLSPDAQREVDHIYIECLTDDPALAERLSPIAGLKQITPSAHDAQLSTERLLKGLPYSVPPDAVYEDYVVVWLSDMAGLITQINSRGAMATPQEISGLSNMSKHVEQFLVSMAQNRDERMKVRQYQDMLGKIQNILKAYVQRLQASAKSAGANGASGADAETRICPFSFAAVSAAKAQNLRESHAQRTAQRQAQFELDQQRLDRQSAAKIRRENDEAQHGLAIDALQRAFQE